MGKIPDRWLPYSSIGQPIEGTKFIAFKVPLKEAICRNLKRDERFTPSMLVEQCPRLSLVVDLTNTHRYYNPQEFLSKGILYEKIFCPGKVIPHDDNVQKFIDIVDGYISQNGDSKESLIGVHCTHGLNRTAYFICNYMIKRLKIPAQEAISAFERARGHAIERQEYIKALINTAIADNTPKPQAEFESPLGSLYEERPLMSRYAVSRNNYHARSGPDYFSNDRRQRWNNSSHDGFLPRPAPSRHYHSQQNGYRNHMEQRQGDILLYRNGPEHSVVRNKDVRPYNFLSRGPSSESQDQSTSDNPGNSTQQDNLKYGNGHRKRSDRRQGDEHKLRNNSEHDQFVRNNGGRSRQFSSQGLSTESQHPHMSGFRKRQRDRNEPCDSGISTQQHSQKFGENARYVRLGDGLAASCISENQSHPKKRNSRRYQDGRQNSFPQRQPQAHTEHEPPFQDPLNSRNDIKAR
ncbi:RNA/RNP complex-1-interacting phosphatase [Anabrus simplex]|uniref:RNA/RNP complex-1-interacting phosphatase n=1 Tax=Anabrus simplex TaxID=316456 RepID=UPI0034DDC74D